MPQNNHIGRGKNYKWNKDEGIIVCSLSIRVQTWALFVVWFLFSCYPLLCQ